MRYSQIRNLDISNGLGVGVSLFVQGCPFHCKNCFNSDTWDFNGGKEWTEKAKDKFIKLINRPYIKRISFLGGECLAEQNLDEILSLIKLIRNSFPEKTIWLYTGYSYSEIFRGQSSCLSQEGLNNFKRREIIKLCNIVVDGEYIDEQKDLSLNSEAVQIKELLMLSKV